VYSNFKYIFELNGASTSALREELTWRTLHRSKHFWVQVCFLWWKRSFASASVFVVFVAETLALIQVYSEKFRSFFSFWEMWYFTGRPCQPFVQHPYWWYRFPYLWPPETGWPRSTVRDWLAREAGGFNSHTQNNCKKPKTYLRT